MQLFKRKCVDNIELLILFFLAFLEKDFISGSLPAFIIRYDECKCITQYFICMFWPAFTSHLQVRLLFRVTEGNQSALVQPLQPDLHGDCPNESLCTAASL